MYHWVFVDYSIDTTVETVFKKTTRNQKHLLGHMSGPKLKCVVIFSFYNYIDFLLYLISCMVGAVGKT